MISISSWLKSELWYETSLLGYQRGQKHRMLSGSMGSRVFVHGCMREGTEPASLKGGPWSFCALVHASS